MKTPSDELCYRLRYHARPEDCIEAAERIKALEKELAMTQALVIERVLKRHYPDNVDHLAVIEEMAHALAAAGYKIMPRELTDELVAAGLLSTAVVLDLQGSQLQKNREKMRVRFRAMWDAAP